MSNRAKAVYFAIISFFFAPFAVLGISSLYVGDVTTWLLAMIFFWTGLGFVLTFLNLCRFLSMTDQEFDREMGAEFKRMNSFKRQKFLLSFGLFCLTVGGALATAKKDILGV